MLPLVLRRSDLKDILQRVKGRGLASWPDSQQEYRDAFEAFKSTMHRIKFPHVIDHPYYPLKVELQEFFDPLLIFLISIGDYELSDLELYDTYIQDDDTVLDIGGGIGLTAAFCHLKSQNKVIVVEPDVRMHPIIERMAELNQAEFEILSGCVLAEKSSEKTVPFFVHQEFWRSTATPTAADQYKKIAVPVLNLQDLLSKYKPTILVMDVEGAEKELFSSPLQDLPKRIFVEIHVPNISEKTSSQVIASICERGYKLIDFRGWMFCFEKLDL